MSGQMNLDEMLRTLQPVVLDGDFVYLTVPENHPVDLPYAAIIREPEGITLVVRREDADAASSEYDFVAAWIMLTVHSALSAVGLTAALAGALTDAGVSCNVLAGYYHDHLLVPKELVDQALSALAKLSEDAEARLGTSGQRR